MRAFRACLVALAFAGAAGLPSLTTAQSADATGPQLLAQGPTLACRNRCQDSRKRCLNEAPRAITTQGVRYIPADDVRRCNNGYWSCVQDCPRAR